MHRQINKFLQIIEIKFMMKASDNALAVALNPVEIYNELDRNQVLQETKRYCRHMCATKNGTLPNPYLVHRLYLLIICISVFLK